MNNQVQRLAEHSRRTGYKVILYQDDQPSTAARDRLTSIVKCAHCRVKWIAVWPIEWPELICPSCTAITRIRTVRK